MPKANKVNEKTGGDWIQIFSLLPQMEVKMGTKLSMRNITKRYPGVIALNHVSIEIEPGEVHALVGENGAGKSTLIKVLSGAIKNDEGEIQIGDKVFPHMTTQLAKENGVAVVYQECSLISSLSVAENIYLGKRFGTLVNRKQLQKMAQETFDHLGIKINPSRPVGQLSSAYKQLVEIVKAVSQNAEIVVMDEPTAQLTVDEVEMLYDIIHRLKADGITVIYISHRMDEIFQITDRVTVMRDGQYITTLDTASTNRAELISYMVGRTLSAEYPHSSKPVGDVVLELKNVSGNGDRDISFSLHRGEILGLGGLVGAGRTELARLIFGADHLESGEILMNGERVAFKQPADAIRHGIGLIPEDRKLQGCFLNNSIRWNISIMSLKSTGTKYLVNKKNEAKQAGEYRDLLRIKTPSIEQLAGNLSGGNQQKVVIAKVLATQSDILIFDEPTRGIDVGARAEIYELMVRLLEEGKSIIMISSDMEELLGMSDRIIVLCEGKIAGELSRSEFSQNKVLDLASGE